MNGFLLVLMVVAAVVCLVNGAVVALLVVHYRREFRSARRASIEVTTEAGQVGIRIDRRDFAQAVAAANDMAGRLR